MKYFICFAICFGLIQFTTLSRCEASHNNNTDVYDIIKLYETGEVINDFKLDSRLDVLGRKHVFRREIDWNAHDHGYEYDEHNTLQYSDDIVDDHADYHELTSIDDIHVDKNDNHVRNGSFYLEDNIFKGGHGEIWRAHKLNRKGYYNHNITYILKRMATKNRPDILYCALREIYFGELLFHLHSVARFESYFVIGDDYWLVFRYEGMSLQSIMYAISYSNGKTAMLKTSNTWKKLRTTKSGQLSMRGMLHQIISNVNDLHELSIVHRDIKPSNILLNVELDPKLILADFSSAVIELCTYTTSNNNNYTSTGTSTNINTTTTAECSIDNDPLYPITGPTIQEETLLYAPPEVILTIADIDQTSLFNKANNDECNFETHNTSTNVSTCSNSSSRRPMPFYHQRPKSYDIWSVGVLFLELILGSADVFTTNQRTVAMLTHKLHKQQHQQHQQHKQQAETNGAGTDQKKLLKNILYLAGLTEFCIFNADEFKAIISARQLRNNDTTFRNSTGTREKNTSTSHIYNSFYRSEQILPTVLVDQLQHLITTKTKTTSSTSTCGLLEIQQQLMRQDPLGVGFNDIWGIDLLVKLLQFNPERRISLGVALTHAYFVGPYVSRFDLSEHALMSEMLLYEQQLSKTAAFAMTANAASDNSARASSGVSRHMRNNLTPIQVARPVSEVSTSARKRSVSFIQRTYRRGAVVVNQESITKTSIEITSASASASGHNSYHYKIKNSKRQQQSINMFQTPELHHIATHTPYPFMFSPTIDNAGNYASMHTNTISIKLHRRNQNTTETVQHNISLAIIPMFQVINDNRTHYLLNDTQLVVSADIDQTKLVKVPNSTNASSVDSYSSTTYDTTDHHTQYSSTSTSIIIDSVISEMNFTCGRCKRVFRGDYNACLNHLHTRKHGKKCIYDSSAEVFIGAVLLVIGEKRKGARLPDCLSFQLLQPFDADSGWCDLAGRRNYMEDYHAYYSTSASSTTITSANSANCDDSTTTLKFYGVFDGHFSSRAAKFSSVHLYRLFMHFLSGNVDSASTIVDTTIGDNIVTLNAISEMNTEQIVEGMATTAETHSRTIASAADDKDDDVAKLALQQATTDLNQNNSTSSSSYNKDLFNRYSPVQQAALLRSIACNSELNTEDLLEFVPLSDTINVPVRMSTDVTTKAGKFVGVQQGLDIVATNRPPAATRSDNKNKNNTTNINNDNNANSSLTTRKYSPISVLKSVTALELMLAIRNAYLYTDRQLHYNAGDPTWMHPDVMMTTNDEHGNSANDKSNRSNDTISTTFSNHSGNSVNDDTSLDTRTLTTTAITTTNTNTTMTTLNNNMHALTTANTTSETTSPLHFDQKLLKSGTTATVVVRVDDLLLLANVGDSRIILCCASKIDNSSTITRSTINTTSSASHNMETTYRNYGYPLQITLDHTPYNDNERQNVLNRGGWIDFGAYIEYQTNTTYYNTTNNITKTKRTVKSSHKTSYANSSSNNHKLLRVNNQLAVTRSLGDVPLGGIISPDPDVMLIRLKRRFDYRLLKNTSTSSNTNLNTNTKASTHITSSSTNNSNELSKTTPELNNCALYRQQVIRHYSRHYLALSDDHNLSYNHLFLINASDGLWDVLSNDAATELVCEYLLQAALTQAQTQTKSDHDTGANFSDGHMFLSISTYQEAARLLAMEALVRGSSDNIGVCVINLL